MLFESSSHAPPNVRRGIGPLLFVFEGRPAVKDLLVAGFPVGVIGFYGEAGLDGEVQGRLILKVDADVVVAGSG